MDDIKKCDKAVKIIKCVPPVFSAAIITCCAVFLINHDFEELLSLTPDNLWLAAAALMGFYALKSMSVVFPLTALFIAVGHIYPLWAAMLVNTAGLCVSFTLPYLAGRFSGADIVDAIVLKYPKTEKIVDYSRNNNLFTAYISRAVVFVPGDVVSVIHGALKMPYRPYLIGSIFGVLPEMVVQTYIGAQLSQLTLKSVLVMAGLIAVTLVLSLALNKKASKM